LAVLLFLTVPLTSQAASFNYQLLEDFPGVSGMKKGTTYTDLLGMVSALYKFGIWTVGIAALLMLVIGGFMYMTSAGNTSRVASAKGVIGDALLGLLAALGAFLLLYVINPDLTKLNLKLIQVNVQGGGSAPLPITGGACTGTNVGCCSSGTKCADCVDCVNFSNGYANLCYTGAQGNTGCKLNSSLADKLNNANLSSVGAQVSETWPPTVNHSSSCHTNGTCADVRCINGCANESVSNVKKIYQALLSAGLSPTFESSNCAPYSSAGIKCINPSTMTSPSFHVNP